MNVSWPIDRPFRKKSKFVVVMPMWQLSLRIQSRTQTDTRALAACLATDCETLWDGEEAFNITLLESTCKDLRAMWNTRLRGLIATDSVLKVFGKHS